MQAQCDNKSKSFDLYITSKTLAVIKVSKSKGKGDGVILYNDKLCSKCAPCDAT